MRFGRRVLAILVAVAALFLVSAPAEADTISGCTVGGQGTVYCPRRADSPIRVGVTGKVVQLVADGDSTCALTEPGDVYCWGGEQPRYRVNRNPMALVALGSLFLAVGAVLILAGRSRGREEWGREEWSREEVSRS
jgi:hypothetical protein